MAHRISQYFFIPREFQYRAERFDDRYCFVGPCLDRPILRSWRNHSDSQPIILISDTAGLGDPHYFDLFVDALSGTKYRVILSIGDEIRGSELRSLPDNFEINRNASHLEILPHVSLLICQGGPGSTLEAIYHGVPVIVLPMNSDHEAWAHRLVELGLGIRLPRYTATADMIKESIQRSLGNALLLAKAGQMKDVVRRSGGAVMAADRIEAFLR